MYVDAARTRLADSLCIRLEKVELVHAGFDVASRCRVRREAARERGGGGGRSCHEDTRADEREGCGECTCPPTKLQSFRESRDCDM